MRMRGYWICTPRSKPEDVYSMTRVRFVKPACARKWRCWLMRFICQYGSHKQIEMPRGQLMLNWGSYEAAVHHNNFIFGFQTFWMKVHTRQFWTSGLRTVCTYVRNALAVKWLSEEIVRWLLSKSIHKVMKKQRFHFRWSGGKQNHRYTLNDHSKLSWMLIHSHS